jgi:deoxyribose-phosphate aldolase
MYTEYYTNNIEDKDIEIKKNIEKLCETVSVKNIIATLHQAKLIKKNFPNLNVGCFLDYPISNYELGQRQESIKNALAYNINYIAITMPSYYLINRKYDKIREDIKQNLELCASNKSLRYILEYRKFDHQILAKACEVLLSCGIDTIYPSSGFFIDSLDDNILACTYLHQKTSIRTIINGNSWNKKHISQIVKSGMYGLSSNNINSLSLFEKFSS